MKKIIAILMLIMVPAALPADKNDLTLMKDIVQGNIRFLNNEQDKERVKQVTFTAPVRKIAFKPAPAAKKTETKTYDFSQKTAYGSFTVNVIEKPDNFKVSFSSEYPIQTYKLVDSRNKNTTKREDIGELTAYSFAVDKPFDPYYVLILTMVSDGITSQNIVPLYNKAQVKTKQGVK